MPSVREAGGRTEARVETVTESQQTRLSVVAILSFLAKEQGPTESGKEKDTIKKMSKMYP